MYIFTNNFTMKMCTCKNGVMDGDTVMYIRTSDKNEWINAATKIMGLN